MDNIFLSSIISGFYLALVAIGAAAYRAKPYMNEVSCKYKTNIEGFNYKYDYEKENE